MKYRVVWEIQEPLIPVSPSGEWTYREAEDRHLWDSRDAAQMYAVQAMWQGKVPKDVGYRLQEVRIQ